MRVKPRSHPENLTVYFMSLTVFPALYVARGSVYRVAFFKVLGDPS